MKKFYSMAALFAALVIPAVAQAELPAYTVSPAVGSKIPELKIIEVTFDGEVELTEGCYYNYEEGAYGNSALNPRCDWEDADYNWIFTNERFMVINGNTLYLEKDLPLDPEHCNDSDWVTVTIKGGSYSVNGEPGEDLVLTWYFDRDIVADTNYTVTPDPKEEIEELKVVEVTFDGEVTLTEGCYFNTDEGATGNAALNPRYDWEGCTYQMIFTNERYEVRNGNTLYLEKNLGLTPEYVDDSEWVTLRIFGASYWVDGEPGEDLEFTYFFNTNGVKSFFGEESLLDVFDMQGRRVIRQGNADDLRTLHGIYIVNGKKVILH